MRTNTVCQVIALVFLTVSIPVIAQPSATAEHILALQQSLAELEGSGHSFTQQIGELSFELGQQLQSQGLHQQALEAFERADQSIKIESGLYALERETLLRQIHQENLKLQDWETAQSSLLAVAWLNARNADSNDLAQIESLREVALWYLAAEAYGLPGGTENQLRQATATLNQIFEIYEANALLPDAQSMAIYLAVNKRIDFYAPDVNAGDIQILIIQEERRVDAEVNTAVGNCYRVYSEQPGLARQCAVRQEAAIRANSPLNNQNIRQQLEDQMYGDLFLRDAERRGTVAIQKYVDQAYAKSDLQAQLDASLLYADWNLWIGRNDAAREHYLKAWNHAIELGMLESMQFGSPQLLDLMSFSDLPAVQSIDGLRTGTLALRVRVKKFGESEEVYVVSFPSGAEAAVAQFVRRFDDVRWRPALEAGVPVTTDDLVMRFQISY